MSAKKVTDLRKQGKLQDALEMAQKLLVSDPENIWNKRAIAWVYYSLLKQASDHTNYKDFIGFLEHIKQLDLGVNESMLFNNLAIQIGLFLSKQESVAPNNLNQIFEIIKTIPFPKKTDSFTFIIKAFKKHATEWDHFLELVNWWDLDSFQDKDYEKYVLGNGRKIPSTVESIYIAIAKKLLQPPVNLSNIKAFVPQIAHIAKSYPDMQYPPYYYAKLLLVLGDREHFMQAFLPFAKKQQRDYWVWDLMSGAFDESKEEYFSCLCKSLNCGAPNKFTINVREKLAEVLINKKQYPEAKYELNAIIDTRTKEAWPLKQKHQDWKNYPWWNSSIDLKDNLNLYKNNLSIAEDLLFSDIKEELLVVERVNSEKTVLNFIVSKQKHGLIFYGKHPIKPKIGEVYAVRFKNNDKPQKSSFYQILSIKPSEQKPPEEICKQIQARAIIKTGNSFGFLEHAYMPAPIINKYELIDGDMVKAKAIQSFNSKRKAWGWLVISIEKQ